MADNKVAGKYRVDDRIFRKISTQCNEITRQLNQKNGCNFDPNMRSRYLQLIIENKMGDSLIAEPKVGEFLTCVTVGEYASMDEIKRSIYLNGYETEEDACRVLENSDCSKIVRVVYLYKVTGQDLGLSGMVGLSDVISKAKSFGFECCSVESATLGFLDCDDDFTFVGMLPVDVLGRSYTLQYGAYHPNVRVLKAGRIVPGKEFGSGLEFVFEWPRYR